MDGRPTGSGFESRPQHPLSVFVRLLCCFSCGPSVPQLLLHPTRTKQHAISYVIPFVFSFVFIGSLLLVVCCWCVGDQE